MANKIVMSQLLGVFCIEMAKRIVFWIVPKQTCFIVGAYPEVFLVVLEYVVNELSAENSWFEPRKSLVFYIEMIEPVHRSHPKNFGRAVIQGKHKIVDQGR